MVSVAYKCKDQHLPSLLRLLLAAGSPHALISSFNSSLVNARRSVSGCVSEGSSGVSCSRVVGLLVGAILVPVNSVLIWELELEVSLVAAAGTVDDAGVVDVEVCELAVFPLPADSCRMLVDIGREMCTTYNIFSDCLSPKSPE